MTEKDSLQVSQQASKGRVRVIHLFVCQARWIFVFLLICPLEAFATTYLGKDVF